MKSYLKILIILFIGALYLGVSKEQVLATLPAFPGAEGAGAYAQGGRGGKVLQVTNLNDFGSGSLRAAVEANGPRIVVFRVGGTIKLNSNLVIRNPYITLAGQTAPGDGITIRGATTQIRTHDVVIRYVRFRLGDQIPDLADTEDDDALETHHEPVSLADTTKMVHDIIVDHTSLSWAIDGNFDFSGNFSDPILNSWAERFTLQWSIISEGLNNSLHPEIYHSTGGIQGSNGTRDVSVHHNLYVHNYSRNPRILARTEEVINNVIYSVEQPTRIGCGHDYYPYEVYLNYIGNYLRQGPRSSFSKMIQLADNPCDHKIYVQGNFSEIQWIGADEWEKTTWDRTGNFDDPQGADRRWQTTTRHALPGIPITIQSYQDAYNKVLSSAGASKIRDQVDIRIVNEVKNRTGSYKDSPTQSPCDPCDPNYTPSAKYSSRSGFGYPLLSSGTAPTDTDHDGMPDDWESLRGLNSNFDDSASDRDSDGYTNIEEYINSLVFTNIDSDFKTSLSSYLSPNDTAYSPIDGKINMLDSGWVVGRMVN